MTSEALAFGFLVAVPRESTAISSPIKSAVLSRATATTKISATPILRLVSMQRTVSNVNACLALHASCLALVARGSDLPASCTALVASCTALMTRPAVLPASTAVLSAYDSDL